MNKEPEIWYWSSDDKCIYCGEYPRNADASDGYRYWPEPEMPWVFPRVCLDCFKDKHGS